MFALLLLLGCTPKAETAALEARVAALEADSEAQDLEIAGLRDRLDFLASREAPPSPPHHDSTAVVGDAPVCTADGDRMMLPSLEGLDEGFLTRSARIVPHQSATGKTDGFRLLAIRPGSLLATCGVKNGDILTSVEGMPVTSMEEMLAAYTGLGDRRSLTFGLIRQSAPVQLTLYLSD